MTPAQQAERAQAELAEAMSAIDILMKDCKGLTARRANLDHQVCTWLLTLPSCCGSRV